MPAQVGSLGYPFATIRQETTTRKSLASPCHNIEPISAVNVLMDNVYRLGG